jgi:hypothetical protein
MYSGDNVGRIVEWTGSKVKSKKQCYQWKLSRCLNMAFDNWSILKFEPSWN